MPVEQAVVLYGELFRNPYSFFAIQIQALDAPGKPKPSLKLGRVLQ